LMRFGFRLMTRVCWFGRVPTKLKVEAKTIKVSEGDSPARIYTPMGSGPFPVIIFYHGGGFVIGDLDTNDSICRDLCYKSGRMVVSISYRLAPEHPFPCAPKDCFDALEWVINNVDSINADINKIFVAGESAGGNLAAVTAIRARDKFPGVLKGQILIYPVTDHYSAITDSYSENATGQGLTRNLMIWFWDNYYRESPLLKEGEIRHDWATPLAVDDLTKLPPALIITAEKDVLRDEGAEFANRLSSQGVKVQYSMYRGIKHGFIGSMGPSKHHNKGIGEIVEWLEDLG